MRQVIKQANAIDNDYQILSKSGLFDSGWYLNQYADVKKIGMDPVEHFLRYGWIMRRNPSDRFNTREYLRQNPDVEKAGVNPLLHFMRKGLAEGRSAPSVSKINSDRMSSPLPISAEQSTAAVPGGDVTEHQNQLSDTQKLLEHYFTRCQELEYKLMDR